MNIKICVFFLILFFCPHDTCASIKSYSPLSRKFKKIINERSPVPVSRLKIISFKHYDFEGNIKEGKIVVLDAVSLFVKKIFDELYNLKFPIHQALPMDLYDGNDDKSMEDNNTSSFNPRFKYGSKQGVSIHAYGCAIDINPVQNPFHYFEDEESKKKGIRYTKPSGSALLYINRIRAQKDGLKGLAEKVIDIFHKNGFTIWGGHWNHPIDWHHFQVPSKLATLLGIMTSEHAQKFFKWSVYNKSAVEQLFEKKNIEDIYNKNPEKFINDFEQLISKE